MKKRLCTIVAVLALACCLTCLAVACQSAPVTKTANGLWQYTIYEETDSDGKVIKDDAGNAQKAVVLDAYLGQEALVVVPNSIEDNGVIYPVKKLGAEAFRKLDEGEGKWRDRETYTQNKTLKEVTLSEGIEEIGGMCFYLCSELTKVNLPESIKSIGDFAFFGCTGLTEITLPKNVNSIGAYSFRACKNLKTVNVLAEGALPKIGDKVFYLVDEKNSDDDQYYIIPELKINVPASAIGLYNADDIEENRKQTKKNDYRYWIDYINAGCIAAIQG